VVNADQFAGLAVDHPELMARTERTIGYWFWELDSLTREMRRSLDMVDEVWVASAFVEHAFRIRDDVPVRLVPLPISEPAPANVGRNAFAPFLARDDVFAFAVVFDHNSVAERKNPFGAIEAFRRAFPTGGTSGSAPGPVLIVKSMNADLHWPQHERLRAAAEGRDDIILWDEHLERGDHMALVRSVDALVSLHRSEGLGLHLAEAMWLGTPVIATRYSGNLDFMDDECAVLIDATLVPVEHGEGVYPPEAVWADPDLDQAAAAMRRMVNDPAWAGELALAARLRMQAQPSLADTGRRIAELLGVEQHPSNPPRVAS
jgi:glycosyltransferase involved in cell wall biosynthesis